MDIKSIIKKTREEKESFWALLLEPGWISAAVWEVVGEEVNIASSGPATKWSEEDELTEVVDTALSACITSLPEDYKEPEKTVFGLNPSWVKEGNIKDEYLGKLKKICDDLSLSPAGFVVLPEAIAHYIKSEEGSPLSGVIVGVADQNLDVSLFKMGKLSGNFSVARSVSLVDDLVEGLSRFSGEGVLPSRIVVYDGKEADLEDARNSFSSFSWENMDKVKFLHTPKVDVIKQEDKVKAVCLAGGAEIAGTIKIVGSKERLEHKEGKEDTIPKDVQNVSEVSGDLSAQDLGFVVNTGLEENQGDKEMDLNSEAVRGNFPRKGFKLKLPSLKLPKPKLPKMKVGSVNNKNPLIIGTVSLLTFFIAAFLFWWFYPKASITIFVSPKKLDESLELTLGQDLSSKDISVEVSGEKTKSTTGTKTVGERAKGSVTIQNGTANSIKLDKGTKIVSSSSLEFTLDNSASVSAALSPSSPGTATVDVTGASIGSEYNLAKDEIFKVGNYPKADVDATSSSDFSGGSSREISAVSEEDIATLEDDLKNELLDEANNKLQEKLSEDEMLLDASLTDEVTSSDFSNKKGDEASTLKLSLTLQVNGLVVSKKDISKASAEALNGKIPSGFVLRDDQISYEFSKVKGEDDKYSVDLSVNLLPNIDTAGIVKEIVGKYPSRAEEYLSNLAGFVRAEFRIKPLFPGKLGTLPHVAKKISVEISADR